MMTQPIRGYITDPQGNLGTGFDPKAGQITFASNGHDQQSAPQNDANLNPIDPKYNKAGGAGSGTGFYAKPSRPGAFNWNGPNVGDMTSRGDAAAGQAASQVDPNAGGAALDRALAVQQQQQGLAGQLNATAMGQGMSAADRQLQQGADQSLANSYAMANSARGADTGMAQYNAMQQGAQTMAQTNQQAGVLRAQESATAQGQLGNLYGQMAGQNAQQQGMDLQNQQYNADLRYKQNALNDQSQQNWYNMANQTAQSELGAGEAQAANAIAQNTLDANYSLGQATNETQQQGAAISAGGTALTALGAAAALSDIRAKGNIAPAGANQLASYGSLPQQGAPQQSAYRPPPPQQNAALQQNAAPQQNAGGANSWAAATPQQNAAGGSANSQGLVGGGGNQPQQQQMIGSAGGNPYASSNSQGLVGGGPPQARGMSSYPAPAPVAPSNPYAAMTAAPRPPLTAQGPMPGQLPPSAGAGYMFSDEELKRSIQPGGHTVSDAYLDALSKSQSTYRYKDPRNEPTDHPTGDHYLGVMAQALERTPTGSTLVKDSPQGKYLELAPNLSASMAGLGRMHERLSALEEALQRKSGGM